MVLWPFLLGKGRLQKKKIWQTWAFGWTSADPSPPQRTSALLYGLGIFFSTYRINYITGWAFYTPSDPSPHPQTSAKSPSLSYFLLSLPLPGHMSPGHLCRMRQISQDSKFAPPYYSKKVKILPYITFSPGSGLALWTSQVRRVEIGNMVEYSSSLSWIWFVSELGNDFVVLWSDCCSNISVNILVIIIH